MSGTVLAVVAPFVAPFSAGADGACDDFNQDIGKETIGSLTNELYEELAPNSAEIDRLDEIGVLG